MSSEKSIVDQIKHYQKDIITSPNDSKRMIRCIERLHVLPVTIAHLQETGVGRSVNELRKCSGEVGAAAHALVCKWKSMVKDEEDSPQASDVEESNLVSNKKNGSSPKRDSYNKDRHSLNKGDSVKPTSNSSHKKTKSSYNSNLSKDAEKKMFSKSDPKSNSDMSCKTSHSSSSGVRQSSSHKSKHYNDSKVNTNNKGPKHEKSLSDYKDPDSKTNHANECTSGLISKNIEKKNYDKKPHRKEENVSLHTYSSSNKYNVNSLDSDSTDDDSIYRPKPSKNSRKRKSSHSNDHELSKRPLVRESNNKKIHCSSSEESDVKKDCDEEIYVNNSDGNSVSSNDNDAEEISNGGGNTENNTSDDDPDSDGRSSQSVSDDYERNTNEQSSDSEREEYIPVKIKMEKESPPRETKSHNRVKSHSNHEKNAHTSNNSSNRSKASNVSIKKEKVHDHVKIKKENDKKESSSSKKLNNSSLSRDKKEHKSKSSEQISKHKSESSKVVKVKIEKEEDGSIGCESGASFGDALLGLSDTKKKTLKKSTGNAAQEKGAKVDEKLKHHKSSSKMQHRTSSSSSSIKSTSSPSFKELDLLSKNIKLEPLDVDLKATLPEITPNYKPLPHYSPPGSPANKKAKLMSQEDALSTIMSTKNQRTKVYSGNKTGYTKVPSLFELCIQVLREHIDALEYTGGVPYDLLKPVLDRATAEQLNQLEYYNPYLVEDTDPLWQFHCSKDFRGKKPNEFETWRELYLRLIDEREQKLQALKENITQSMAKSTPIRQTKLAYVDSVVKPPRNIARKQMKYGTSKAVKHELVAKAMVGAASSSPAPEVTSVPAPSRPSSSSAFPIPNFLKKKKAPLMAKALQLIKGNRFKR